MGLYLLLDGRGTTRGCLMVVVNVFLGGQRLLQQNMRKGTLHTWHLAEYRKRTDWHKRKKIKE